MIDLLASRPEQEPRGKDLCRRDSGAVNIVGEQQRINRFKGNLREGRSIQAKFTANSNSCKEDNTMVTVVYYRGAIVMTIVPLTRNHFSPIFKELLRVYGGGRGVAFREQ
jgi:hypothetical protein